MATTGDIKATLSTLAAEIAEQEAQQTYITKHVSTGETAWKTPPPSHDNLPAERKVIHGNCSV